MQNGGLNGTSEKHPSATTPEPENKVNGAAHADSSNGLGNGELIPRTPKEDDVAVHHNNDGPPPKKRKLTDSQRSTPRPISPPWKRVGVEGPSSFIEGGRRKSTRTNAVPLELQPQSGKRQTRAAQKDYISKAKSSRPSVNVHPTSETSPSNQSTTNGKKSVGVKATLNGAGKITPRRELPRTPSAKTASGKKPAVSQSRPMSSRTRAQSTAASISQPKSGYHATPATQASQRPRRDTGPSVTTSPLMPRHANADERRKLDENKDGELEDTNLKLRLPRLRFKVKMPSVRAQHPFHVLPPRRFTSFRDWVDSGQEADEDGGLINFEDAREEARLRERLREAGEPGNILSKDRCSVYIPDEQEEPSRQYSHQDHLVAHALYFRKLLDREHKHHRHTAKLLAQWCAEAWRKRNKRPEDILREQQEEERLKRRQLIKDLQRQFDLVRAEVESARLARWEEEKKALDQEALNRAIKQSTMLFEKRRMEMAGEIETDAGDQSEDGTGLDESSNESGEDESNMSSDESDGEEDGGYDTDEGLTAEELRLKYAGLPRGSQHTAEYRSQDDAVHNDDVESSVMTHVEESASKVGSPTLENDADVGTLDEVDPLLLDDSDESTDMDDDMGDSDNSEASSEDEDFSDVGDQGAGLLGFYSSRDTNIDDAPRSEDEDQGESEHDLEDEDEVTLVPNNNLNTIEAVRDIPKDILEAEDEATAIKDVDEDDIPGSDIEEPQTAKARVSPALPNTKEPEAESPESSQSVQAPKTPIPHLLRGILREYQHVGLDWLAGLYKNNINGILADEMGLGKTIQTIALLAHLAVEHEVWGPHLVVVPTSVMLNWEMEFKKWCPGFKILTYYGTQEERKQKRRGWLDDDRWHVCITSYQLVLQDQQTFRRRNWHYMVLDEAHNIKNFRSQRWQTLLTFKTRARLLLTGTPLQNNLTELWSLLFFLMPSDGREAGIDGFADLKDFSDWFRRPVEQILEHGRETMDDEAKRVVTKLHTILRPYILRRLKADVEKQMPAKYEHVVFCRLSKRQRYLYDGFMSRAQTKETLASGNYLSIINCLMQLRKVCNHPDLFETRPITTSFAIPKSAVSEFEIKEFLVRRRLLHQDPFEQLDLDFLNLVPISREHMSRRLADDSTRIMAYKPFKMLRERQYNRTNWLMEFDGSSVRSALMSMENATRKSRMQGLERCLYFESKRHGQHPVYGQSLIDFLTREPRNSPLSRRPPQRRSLAEWLSNRSSVLASMIWSINERSQAMESNVQKFACITPAAIASGVTEAALQPITHRSLTQEQRTPVYDPFHEAQMRLSIAFPDKRLLQYDCGKLQRLDKLLRDLQAGGHRALIFTQMTKMLDILEQFLNIHGHRYLRLDGATKVEQRQILTDRFNNDTRILAFILSSRSGGLGINLTGADTVIFYDLDWNPAMDKQCQDRCHRIGQTRDVHIYRFVSEYTIESNILRKANQKRMLDDVVIQEGEFTTDYMNKLDVRDVLEEGVLESQDEASAAMDRVLDTRARGTTRVFEQAEDKEDIDAAKNAEKELAHADDGDFEEPSVSQGTPGQAGTSQAATPMTTAPLDDANESAHAELEEAEPNHIDDYLIRFMEWNLKDEPLLLPPDKSKKKSKKGKEHQIRRHR